MPIPFLFDSSIIGQIMKVQSQRNDKSSTLNLSLKKTILSTTVKYEKTHSLLVMFWCLVNILISISCNVSNNKIKVSGKIVNTKKLMFVDCLCYVEIMILNWWFCNSLL